MAAAMRPVTVGTVASVDLVSRKQKGYNFLSHQHIKIFQNWGPLQHRLHSFKVGLPMCGVEMASRKKQTYQNKAKNLCIISFSCLTWTVNANSLRQNIIVIKEICSSQLPPWLDE